MAGARREAALPHQGDWNMSLIHCIYASTSTGTFSPRELAELLGQARVNNAARGVSGILLHVDGSFFQVLEGEPADVDPLFTRILSDPRHRQVTMIMREPIARRCFADWSMGFAEVATTDLTHGLSVNDFFETGSCLYLLNSGRAKKLLTAFAAGRWRSRAPLAALSEVANAS
jgi:hypothetical protein